MLINKGNGTCKVLENKFSLRDSLKNKWILVEIIIRIKLD